MEKSSSFNKSDICLPKVRTEIQNCWGYVTLNPDAMPVSDALGPLHDIIATYKIKNYVPVLSENYIQKPTGS